VADAGTVTFKTELYDGVSAYSAFGSEFTVAMTNGDVKTIVIPYRFCGGDKVKVSFKASSVASDPQLKIDVLAYVSGKELDFPGTVALVDDTAWALTASSPVRTILTGSGSNATGSLPDATTLEVGREFVIVNAGTEFVPVKNHGTASSVDVAIYAGDSIVCTCIDNSSAAGTWVVTVASDYVSDAYAAIGDSLTTGAGYPYTIFLGNKYSDSRWYNYGVGGEYATALIFKQSLQALGLLRWRFRESYYPFTLSSLTASISAESLEILQPASGYMALQCLPVGQEVTITGDYQTATSSRLKIYSSSTADILTTTAAGSFSVTYTPVADREEIRITTVGGTTGDAVTLHEFQIELTSRAESANKSVFIWAGINDIIANVQAPAIFEALMFQAEQATQSGVEPVLFRVLPFGASAQYTAAREAVRVELNAMIDRSGYKVVDTSIVSYGTSIKSQYDYGDGLHLNQAGQESIGESVDQTYFGTYGDFAKGYDSAKIGGIAISDTPASVVNKTIRSNTFENSAKNSEDLDLWLGVRVANTGYNEITGDSSTNTHYKAHYQATLAGTYVMRMKVKAADKTWLRVSNATKNRSGNFDIGNIALGTMGVDVRGKIKKLADGYCEVMVELPADVQANNSFTIIPAVNDSTTSYTGDGTTVDMYVEEVQMYYGVLEDDYQYVTTATLAIPNYSVFEWESPLRAYYESIGWLQRVDSGEWECPIASTDTTQYSYTAPTGDLAKYGTASKVISFAALSDGDELGTATKIHGGAVTVSDGTNRITLPLNYTDGTNTVSIYLSGTTGSGTITVSLTGYTIISGCVVYE
jgi:hypothetical protein